MNSKHKLIAAIIFVSGLFLSACGAGQMFGATITPTPTSTNTPTLTPTPTATATQTPTLTPTPTQIGGGSGRFIFELKKEDFAEKFPNLEGERNIFIANTDGTNFRAITNGLEGNNFIQDISPDGTKLLISSAPDRQGNLYCIDLSSPELNPIKLASDLPEYSWVETSAKWIDNTKLVFIGEGESGFGIYSVNSDGSNQRVIYKQPNGDINRPVEILAIFDKKIYWSSQTRTNLGGNRWDVQNYPWWSDMNGDGTKKEPLEVNGKQIEFDSYFYPLAFSPDGNWLVWMGKSEDRPTSPINRLHITSFPTMEKDQYIDIMWSYATIKWFVDSSKVLVFDYKSIEYSYSYNYDTSADLFGLYTVSTPPLHVENEHRTDVFYTLIPPSNSSSENHCSGKIGDFSPDGQQLLVFSSKPNTECETDVIYMLDLETMTFSEVLSGINASPRVYWLP